MLYKIYEKMLQGRITLYFDANNKLFPNRQQQGFQPSLSCVSTAFVVQEVIQYNIDNGSCTYAAFLIQEEHLTLFGIVHSLLNYINYESKANCGEYLSKCIRTY